MFRQWFGRKGSSGANETGAEVGDHLIDLRNVVKTYQSAAGSFTALKGVTWWWTGASSWPSSASRAAASPP